MKLFCVFLLLFFAFVKSYSQIVEFPDSLFKEKLLNHDPVIDLNNDGEIQLAEAKSFDGLMNLTDINPLITDLSGIEAFINIIGLDCRANPITTIDLQYNTALRYLDCSYTNVSIVNVSQCKSLEEIYIDHTEILFLNLTNNPTLRKVYLRNNLLIELDLSHNTQLESVHLGYNLLLSLDLRNGNNTHIDSNSFFIANNDFLGCVFVDDSQYSSSNWIFKDPTTTYVETQEECDKLGISDYSKANFTIFPNPVNNRLTFYSESLSEKEIQIFDIYGKLLSETKASGASISIDFSRYPIGVYYAIVTEGKKNVIQKKIIKK
ncbi:MAG: T9SS type A sorting domain-containing protein [Flavobacteriaceae bacterium]